MDKTGGETEWSALVKKMLGTALTTPPSSAPNASTAKNKAYFLDYHSVFHAWVQLTSPAHLPLPSGLFFSFH